MNKGSMVLFCGAEYDFKGRNNFTKKKAYKVLAGQGDGVPRNDGKLGAFIQNEHQFVVEDDRGNLRVQTITSKDWKLIKEWNQLMFQNRNTNRQFSSPPACANITSLRKMLRENLEAKIKKQYNKLSRLKNLLQYGWGKRKCFNYHNYVTFAKEYRKEDEVLVILLRKRRQLKH